MGRASARARSAAAGMAADAPRRVVQTSPAFPCELSCDGGCLRCDDAACVKGRDPIAAASLARYLPRAAGGGGAPARAWSREACRTVSVRARKRRCVVRQRDTQETACGTITFDVAALASPASRRAASARSKAPPQLHKQRRGVRSAPRPALGLWQRCAPLSPAPCAARAVRRPPARPSSPMRATTIFLLAVSLSVALLLQLLSCILWSNWWPLLTGAVYVLVPMPFLLLSGGGAETGCATRLVRSPPLSLAPRLTHHNTRRCRLSVRHQHLGRRCQIPDGVRSRFGCGRPRRAGAREAHRARPACSRPAKRRSVGRHRMCV